MPSSTTTDRIEKTITLRAPRSRVWRALTNADEFGTWFRATFEGPFVQGTMTRGRITDPGYEHLTFDLQVERIEPERLLSFRWHPNAVEPNVDYTSEPTTLVEFRLEDAGRDTKLTIVESGFDRIPLSRRDEAFRMNDQGWSEQAKNIERHVATA